MAAVRYIVDDVDAAIAFYTAHLGFEVEMHPAPAFAALRRDDLRLYLNRPGGPGGAAQPAIDGRQPEPGGWSRFQIVVEDIEATVEQLRAAGVAFRTELVTGVGGKQVLLEDPAGNCVELFEPGQR
jgi:catechol 2,3-dioxygenase-like lactoylglutathione lyase family enzyme